MDASLNPRDASSHARLLRRLWERSGKGGRRVLVRWAKWWLRRRAPVVVPVPWGQMVLNGPGFCARAVFLTGGYELQDEAHFRALLKPGMTAMDLGANLGIYTLMAAHSVGPGGTVHAFEPVPELFRYLQESVRRSGLTNVLLNQQAVSRSCGTAPMYLAEELKHSGWHSLAPSARRPRTVEVETVSLDRYAGERGIQRVDVLKIDVEGAELLAFQGGTDLLASEGAPIIQAELCDGHCAPFGYSGRELKEYLAGMGYVGYRAAGPTRWRAVAPGEPHPRAENVLFVKASHRDRVPREWSLPEPGSCL